MRRDINDPTQDLNNLPSDDFRRFYYSDANGRYAKPSESMELSASNYYAPREESYADITTEPTAEGFEFEKIKSSDTSKLNVTPTTSEEAAIDTEHKPNITETQVTNGNPKYSKLLFSSPSATVTSNGPSGPFKAIICHDCENSEGRNVGHSVSFSAIKSWNVGSSNPQSQLEQIDANRTAESKPTYPQNDEVIKAPDKYFNTQNSHEENQQIEMNDKVELYKVENISTEKPIPAALDTWNYSLRPINNDNAKHGHNNNNRNEQDDGSNPASPKRPIFNDLLKVPYDVLNAPLTEPHEPEARKNTQIHINHQQKFNDTISSNYQHFQQFIQKNLKPNPMTQHYQSTQMPEQNYEVDESVSVMTNGRAHGVQSTTAQDELGVEKNPQHLPSQQEQDAKFGYVVEGRNFRKYRVEE